MHMISLEEDNSARQDIQSSIFKRRWSINITVMYI